MTAQLPQTIPAPKDIKKKNFDLKVPAAELTSKQLLLLTKRDLGIVSRNLENMKKELLKTLAQRPIKGFNAQQNFNSIQKKIDQIYSQLDSLAIQQRASMLTDLANLMTKFQNNVKHNINFIINMRLANMQGKIYILAEKTKNFSTKKTTH